MIFCGMVGIKDPARTEVPTSIVKCREAHIRVIVITGDKLETAVSICKEIKVFENMSEKEILKRSYLGRDFMQFAIREKSVDEDGVEVVKLLPSDKQRTLLKQEGSFLFA